MHVRHRETTAREAKAVNWEKPGRKIYFLRIYLKNKQAWEVEGKRKDGRAGVRLLSGFTKDGVMLPN